MGLDRALGNLSWWVATTHGRRLELDDLWDPFQPDPCLLPEMFDQTRGVFPYCHCVLILCCSMSWLCNGHSTILESLQVILRQYLPMTSSVTEKAELGWCGYRDSVILGSTAFGILTVWKEGETCYPAYSLRICLLIFSLSGTAEVYIRPVTSQRKFVVTALHSAWTTP